MAALSYSDDDLCNLALGKIGVSKSISLTDGSLEATRCALLLERSRRQVLSSHPWSWATRAKALDPFPLDATESPTKYVASLVVDYAYAYEEPTDLAAVQRLWNGKRRSRPDEQMRSRLARKSAPLDQIFSNRAISWESCKNCFADTNSSAAGADL
jgi:hypothetical protein